MKLECALHPEELLTLICIQDSCPNKDLICEKCRQKNHFTHTVIPHSVFLAKAYSIINSQNLRPNDSEKGVLFDIRKNTEIIKRYINEIKEIQTGFLGEIEKGIRNLNSQIAEQELKINDPIESYNPENLKSVLFRQGKDFDLGKYREVLKKVVKSFKIREDSNGWEVEKEDIYAKKTEETFQLERMLGKFKLGFQDKVRKLGMEVQKIFCLDELMSEKQSETAKQDLSFLGISSAFVNNISVASKNYDSQGVWCESPNKELGVKENMEIEALTKYQELVKPLELNQAKQSFDERSQQLSLILIPDQESNEITNLKSQKVSLEKKDEITKTDEEKLKEYVFSAFVHPAHQELKKIQIKRQSFSYDGILNSKMYRGSKEVKCHFCQGSSFEKEQYRKLGQIFGPFSVKGENYFFHEMCVLWSGGIEMNQQNSIEHSIEGELERTKTLMCVKCGLKGAGVPCLDSECEETAHFRCMINMKELKVNYNRLGFFCGKHFKRGKDERREIKNMENASKKIKKEKVKGPRSKKLE